LATVHLIHGYLGVGKTTLARRLERELPAIRFTHDEWMARLYGNDPPLEMFADYYKRVYGLIGTLWPRCVALGNDVVLDFGFWSRAERDRMRAAVAAEGAACVLYDVLCPEAEAWGGSSGVTRRPGRVSLSRVIHSRS
jgi:predicted kinase